MATHAQATSGLTCNACMVSFGSLAALRDHYRRDFHRYNLKRKVAGLGPISDKAFYERKQAVLASRKGATKAKAEHARTFRCMACKKTFSSRPPYLQHLASKKHKSQLKKLEARQLKASRSENTAVVEKARETIQALHTPTGSPVTGPAPAMKNPKPLSVCSAAATAA